MLENNSKLFKSSTPTTKHAPICIEQLYICLQELGSDEEFQRLFTKVTGLVGAKGLDEAGAAKRKRAKPISISDFVAYSQNPIESINMGGRIFSVPIPMEVSNQGPFGSGRS